MIVVAQTALFTRLLGTAYDFDEGVYLLSLEALRAGEHLGTEVFAAQPPAFYWLLQAIAALHGDSGERIRLGIALSSLAGTAGAWFVVRFIAGPVAGLLAAGLLLISPPIPLFAARILADLPALWATLAALGLAALAVRRESRVVAALAGSVAILAVASKVAAVIALPVVAVVLLSGGGRGRQRLVWAGGGAAVVAGLILIANAGAIGELWGSVVTYHHKAGATPAVIDRWASIRDLFNPRTPAFWLVACGILVFAYRAVRRFARPVEFALWGWAFVAFLFLATYAPLHYNHLVALPVPLAVAAATSIGAQAAAARGRWRTVAVATLAIVVVAGYAQQWRRVAIAGESQSRIEVTAAETLRRVTRPDDLVASDLPVSAILAGRRVPGPIVDTAHLRFQTGFLTSGTVLAEIDQRCVAAVAAGRAFRDDPALMKGLRTRFARSSTSSGATVYWGRRSGCTPSR
jgi:4-amino-4-deoxy-L-arabinose transferase-like glycosyltransferase